MKKATRIIAIIGIVGSILAVFSASYGIFSKDLGPSGSVRTEIYMLTCNIFGAVFDILLFRGVKIESE